MGNVFKSLALAATLAASDAQSAAPNQGEDTLALKNERAKAVLAALEGVKAGTPAGKSTAAVDSVISLAEDGEITPEDAATIASFGSKIYKAGNPVGLDGRPVGQQDQFGLNNKLKELANALTIKDAVELPTAKSETNENGVGSGDVNSDQNVIQNTQPEAKPMTKKSPSLLETKDEKKARLEKEKQLQALQKMIDGLNKGGFFDKKAWGSTDAKGAHCDIKITKDTITTEFKKQGTRGTNPKSTAFFHLGLLPGRTYTVSIGDISGEASSVGIKLRDSAGALTPLIKLTKGANKITIPAGYSIEQTMEIGNTAIAPTTTIQGLSIQDDGDEAELAAN